MQITNEKSARDAQHLKMQHKYEEYESNIALNCILDVKQYFCTGQTDKKSFGMRMI